ncbi:unnamed protein product [Sphagnum troendelagicum]|uniref:Uncharacterized protein n=1 Tax=Sphagnum troendelagicum TaxID=128251 RepID=A0ABP0TNM7_9BRYO
MRPSESSCLEEAAWKRHAARSEEKHATDASRGQPAAGGPPVVSVLFANKIFDDDYCWLDGMKPYPKVIGDCRSSLHV